MVFLEKLRKKRVYKNHKLFMLSNLVRFRLDQWSVRKIFLKFVYFFLVCAFIWNMGVLYRNRKLIVTIFIILILFEILFVSLAEARKKRDRRTRRIERRQRNRRRNLRRQLGEFHFHFWFQTFFNFILLWNSHKKGEEIIEDFMVEEESFREVSACWKLVMALWVLVD